MCSSKTKSAWSATSTDVASAPPVAPIDGRRVLQPAGNRVASLDRRNSLKKISPKSVPPPPLPLPSTTSTKLIKPSSSTSTITTPPISPKSKSPRPPAIKRGNDPNGLNSSVDKALTPRSTPKLMTPTLVRKKSKKSMNVGNISTTTTIEHQSSSSLNFPSSLIIEAPGSIAAARREQVTLIQAQRKMKIAHYGRTKSAKFEGNVVAQIDSSNTATSPREKRCSFITANSDPLYIAYHDEEWGVPVHDDKLLFELLVLSGAQVGSDWTSILKKRQDFRDAFSGFDAKIVANFNERQITSISADYGIELSRVRGTVDNSNRILEIQREFSSFNKYLWSFVNNKPISTQYKSSHKIPVKTSKSETISKDMVRRGFRCVGPTVMHSFMQAAGLTNDHLITCPRHLQCVALASHPPTVAPAL